MAFKELNPIQLTPGTTVELNDDGTIKTNVIGGQAVRLMKKADGSEYLIPSVGTDDAATASPRGFAYKGSVAEPANALYVPFNQYKGPNNLVSVVKTALIDGEFWNDGTGDVYEDDVIGATPGTLLYVSANSKLTVTKGADGTVGSIVVAEVKSAPVAKNTGDPATANNSVLVAKTFI